MPDRYYTFDTTLNEKVSKEAIDASAGSADAGKIPALNAQGKLDESLLPVFDSASYEASENLSAGDLVNLFNDGGVTKMRRADRTNQRQADGYVRDNINSGDTGTMYRDGEVTGKTFAAADIGKSLYLDVTGQPSVGANDADTAGQYRQKVGRVETTTSMQFEKGEVVVIQ